MQSVRFLVVVIWVSAMNMGALNADDGVIIGRHDFWVWQFAISPDNRHFATASYDKTVKLWDLRTQRELFHMRGHTAAVACVAYSRDGKLLASGSHDGSVLLWDVSDGRRIRRLAENRGAVRAVAFDPTGRHLAFGGDDGVLEVVDVATSEVAHRLRVQGERRAIHSVRYLDEHRVLFGSGSRVVRADLKRETVEILQSIHHFAVKYITSTDDRERLFTAESGGIVAGWDVETYRPKVVLRVPVMDGVQGFAIDDARRLVVTSDVNQVYRLEFWDLGNGKRIDTITVDTEDG
ncbi:MAG: hypothetical protein KDA55_22710, partial [Planctomycetales bacterium]|nr:hypothetical protein [Planctomycetales bacterium]